MISLREAVAETLEQASSLVEACSQNQYVTVFSHASSNVGQHMRHILDHFSAIQMGLESGRVDYNVRQRQNKIETNQEQALESLNQWLAWLGTLTFSEEEISSSIEVHSEVSVRQAQSLSVSSTIAREWMYIINHTVHHLAYATLGARQVGVVLPSELGLAPSTASFLREQANKVTA